MASLLWSAAATGVCTHSNVYLGEMDEGMDDRVFPAAPAVRVPVIRSEGGKPQV